MRTTLGRENTAEKETNFSAANLKAYGRKNQ